MPYNVECLIYRFILVNDILRDTQHSVKILVSFLKYRKQSVAVLDCVCFFFLHITNMVASRRSHSNVCLSCTTVFLSVANKIGS